MKRPILFSRKNKRNISKYSLLKFLPSMQVLNETHRPKHSANTVLISDNEHAADLLEKIYVKIPRKCHKTQPS